ncbi:hypothetical protein [Nonomuraea dietziae]|uniref:hypothetical protein n=1 Tax=Nonomuraea dietziae TaxID=65515 RepID=UPI003412C090
MSAYGRLFGRRQWVAARNITSLLATLRELQAEDVRELGRQYAHQDNWGVGAVQVEHLDGARAMLKRIDRLRREVASYVGW